MQLAYPYLLLLALVVLPLFYFYQRRRVYGKIKMSTVAPMRVLPTSVISHGTRHLLFFCRLLTLLLIILAMARPQQRIGYSIKQSEGLDMMLIIDTSGSMRALDFLDKAGKRKSRLAVVKEVLAEFIANRPDDRIGMIVFGDEAYTQAPLTSDQEVLLAFLQQVEIGMAGENTAIGDALGVSTKRLKDVQAKSKIAILLTDGENTAGILDPLVATSVAAKHHIKVYTVGIGSNAEVPIPHAGRFFFQHLPLDEKLMRKIATATGGKYFKASDTSSLQEIYRTIDRLEKTTHQEKRYDEYRELYHLPLWSAVLFFLFEQLLTLTRFRRLP